MRPIGPDITNNLPRKPSVGDGPKPSADASVLRRQQPAHRAGIPVPTVPGTAAQHRASAASPVTGTAAALVAHQSISIRAQQLAGGLGLPSGPASLLVVAAMMAERLPLDAGTAAAIRRFARNHHDDPAAVRIAARAAAAGLDPEGPEAEHLFAVGDGDSGAGDDGAGSAGDQSAGDRSAGHQPADQTGMSNDEAQGSRRSDEVALVGSMLQRAVGAALGDADMAAMQAPGADGSGWVCTPFSVPVGGIPYHGFIRIWYDAMKKHAGPLLVDVRTEDGRRVIELAGRGEARSLRYFSDDPAENRAFVEHFQRYGQVLAGNLSDSDAGLLDTFGAIDEDV